MLHKDITDQIDLIKQKIILLINYIIKNNYNDCKLFRKIESIIIDNLQDRYLSIYYKNKQIQIEKCFKNSICIVNE